MTGAEKAPACDVRRVERRDLGALVAMCGEHAAYERAAYDPSGKADALEQALFGASPRLRAWVAEVDGEPLGYVAASSEFSTWSAREFLHMDCLFVREQFRGKGIGAAMLAGLAQYARGEGFAELQWQTPAWNVDAERFYRRAGAVGHAKIRFTLASAAI